jgi:hypothetical protein
VKRPVSSASLRLQEEWIRHLHGLAREAWCRRSSQDPLRWRPEVPEYGQCGATALVVQDVLGGGLLTGRLTHDGRRFLTHCWNLLEGDVEVDLTRAQLRGARLLGTSRVTRAALLAHPPTAQQYAFLAARIAMLDHTRRRGRRRPPG